MRALKSSKIWLLALVSVVLFASMETHAFTGRIAWSSDGNDHDTDDWLASPWALAMFRAAGMTEKVVYFGYNSHIWGSKGDYAQIHENNITGTVSRWGGYDNSIFYNEVSDPSAAVSKLIEEINKSTAADPLWLVAAGPIETIGRAVDGAQASKLQYVTLLSHHHWNTTHAASKEHNSIYSLEYVQSKGINYKKIQDQNAGSDPGTMTSQGLKRAVEVMEFLKDHPDDRISWLWTCRKMPEYEQPDYQKGKYDYSDAGMAYWLITGADKGGDENGNPEKTLGLLEKYLGIGVSNPPAPVAIPGKIEAEDFTSNSGTETELASDAGGTHALVNIQNGDYAEYSVSVEASKTYRIRYRVASAGAGGSIVLSSKGSTLATTQVAPTGGWQTWTIVSEDIQLSAGEQTIRLTFTGGSGSLFNVNYFVVLNPDDYFPPPYPHTQPGVFEEKDGMVVIDAVSVPANGGWELADPTMLSERYTGYSGQGVMVNTGGTEIGSTNWGSDLVYKIKINSGGKYKPYIRGMAWATIIENGEIRKDAANDCFIQMVGQSGPEGKVKKFYIRGYRQREWYWMGTGKHDMEIGKPGSHDFHDPEYTLSEGEHEFIVYGRSKNFAFDRIVIAKSSISDDDLTNLSNPESVKHVADAVGIIYERSFKHRKAASPAGSSRPIEVYDLAGRKIKTIATLRSIDNLRLPAGIYTARQGTSVVPLLIR